MIIGICGCSGSGKTFLSYRIKNYLKQNYPTKKVFILSIDNFYKSVKQYSKTQLKNLIDGTLNYDSPDMIDFYYLIDTLTKLKNKEDTDMPIYDFTNYDRLPSKIIINEKYDVIIVEGIFAFHFRDILKMLDYKIYLDTNSTICYNRRLLRAKKSRKHPLMNELKEIEYYYNYVIAGGDIYVKPTKSKADIVFKKNSFDLKLLKSIFDLIA